MKSSSGAHIREIVHEELGSARVAIIDTNESEPLQGLDSGAQLLDERLQPLHRSDHVTYPLYRGSTVGNLTARAFRCGLEAIDDHLCDWVRLKGPCVNEGRVVGSSAHKGLQVSQASNQDFVGTPTMVLQPVDGFDADRQIARDGKFSVHNKSPYAARAVTRYVADAILTASRWLQCKAVTRRAVPGVRPSGVTESDGP